MVAWDDVSAQDSWLLSLRVTRAVPSVGHSSQIDSGRTEAMRGHSVVMVRSDLLWMSPQSPQMCDLVGRGGIPRVHEEEVVPV